MHRTDLVVNLLPVKAVHVKARQDGLLTCLTQHACKHMLALDDAKGHGHPVRLMICKTKLIPCALRHSQNLF